VLHRDRLDLAAAVQVRWSPRITASAFEQDLSAPRIPVWLAAACPTTARTQDAEGLATELRTSRPGASPRRCSDMCASGRGSAGEEEVARGAPFQLAPEGPSQPAPG
jgi:hypothetical protein